MIIENLSGVKHEEKGFTAEIPIVKHEKQYSEDAFIRMHYHSSFEFNICEGTQGTINVEGRTFDLSKVKLIFLPPRTLHSYRIKSNKGNIKVWHLGLHLFPLINSKAIEDFFHNSTYQISRELEFANKSEDLLEDIEKFKDLNKSAAVLNLLNQFHKTLKKAGEPGENPFLHKIINWSESNYHESITLDQGAAAVHLSRYHFARKFKSHTGSTYMEYLNNLRLESSLQSLNAGCSVSETAERSGFSDVSYFIKKFRLTYGHTPLEYQKK